MDIAVVVQRQIASTRAGVMFTIDPVDAAAPTGIVIEGAFGLGESVVSGSVSPDRYIVDKATLAIVAREVKPQGARHRAGCPTAARSRASSPATRRVRPVLADDEVAHARRARVPDRGALRRAAGHRVGVRPRRRRVDAAVAGRSRRPAGRGHRGAPSATASRSCAASAPRPAGAAGAVAVSADARRTPAASARATCSSTHMTAPDWVPLMRRAAAIVTDSGGMTCHAAIVSRELGIPCVVGTGDATTKLRDGEIVTVDATHGVVLEGASQRRRGRHAPRPPAAASPRRRSTATKLLVNLSEPSQVERAAALDVDGVGLLRAELMVLEALEGTHPRLLIEQGRGEEFVRADGRRR